MNELEAVRALAPVAPAPSAAVLAAAMETAGLGSPTADPGVPAEPLALIPRRPRRTRRRMVSLTVALASTGVAAAVVGGIALAGSARHTSLAQPGASSTAAAQPSGMTFPADAQLEAAQWFHVSSTQKTGSCPGIRQVWFDRTGKADVIRLEEGTSRDNPCAPVDLPALGPYFAEQPHPLADVAGLHDSDAQLKDVMVAASQTHHGQDARSLLFEEIGENFFETPLNSRTRGQLFRLLQTIPGVTSVAGSDALGRPVEWVTRIDTNGRDWLGFDPGSLWRIAGAQGAAAPDDGPLDKGSVVTAIDTSAPTPVVETDAEKHPSPALTPSPCPVDEFAKGTCGIVTPLIDVPGSKATPTDSPIPTASPSSRVTQTPTDIPPASPDTATPDAPVTVTPMPSISSG